MALLFTIRDGVGKVAPMVDKQCYQRNFTLDTELYDDISEPLYHHYNSSTLLLMQLSAVATLIGSVTSLI